MDYSIAKNKVITLYTEFDKNKDPYVYESLSREEVTQIYFALQNRLPGKDIRLNWMFACFIKFTMSKYNRFGTLRIRDNEDLYSRYRAMLNCLKRVEPQPCILSWYHQLNLIRWDVYRECANRTITEEIKNFIDKKLSDLNKIRPSKVNANLLKAIDDMKAHLMTFFQAVKTGIATTICTSLPYKLTSKNSTFHLVYEGIEIDVSIENSLKSYDRFFPNQDQLPLWFRTHLCAAYLYSAE